VFSFNEGQANLYARNPNIQLLLWYNGMVPSIQYFLFINGTDDLCFVEEGGRARIFNLINLQFRPAVCNLPSNTANVLSTPDGSCIVAFVKEKIETNKLTQDDKENDEEKENDDESDDENDDESDNESDKETDSIVSIDDDRDNNTKEICRAYIYFCTNFGGSVSKGRSLNHCI